MLSSKQIDNNNPNASMFTSLSNQGGLFGNKPSFTLSNKTQNVNISQNDPALTQSNTFNIPKNGPVKDQGSKFKLTSTIYPSVNKINIPNLSVNSSISQESDLESRKNILGISRSEISDRVIEAISKNMSLKDFFMKASEDIYGENKFSNKFKGKGFERQHDIYDSNYPLNDNYLEGKYQIQLQKEMIRQKQFSEKKKNKDAEISDLNNIDSSNQEMFGKKDFSFGNKKKLDLPQNKTYNNFSVYNKTLENTFNKPITKTSTFFQDELNLKSFIEKEYIDLKGEVKESSRNMLLKDEFDINNPKFWEKYKSNQIEAKPEVKKESRDLKSKIKKVANKLTDFFTSFSKDEKLTEISKKEPTKRIINLIAEIKGKDILINFQSHIASNVEILKSYILEKVREMNSIKFENLQTDNFIILFKNSILSEGKCLSDYELDFDKENILTVIINSEKILSYSNNLPKEARRSTLIQDKENLRKKGRLSLSRSPARRKRSRHLSDDENLLSGNLKSSRNDKDYYPILSNDFETFPQIELIFRMRKNELKNVENFKIWNNFGKIKFLSKVDLTNLNLNQEIIMDKFFVEIYPGRNLPNPGKGLNLPAIVTIKQLFNIEENLEELKNSIIQKKGKFIKYNPSKGYLKFEIKEWCK